MELSLNQLQAKLMRMYYQDFSKYSRGAVPEHKVAWVTAFTPVEILEMLGVRYIYPESYAAVIAASGREQESLIESEQQGLCRDCCSYSCCFNGTLELQKAPRGMPARPDVLIATNNQCNTLPNWWSMLSEKYKVPLIVLDYPGESGDEESNRTYVISQHQSLIEQMETLSGNSFQASGGGRRLSELIENSRASVKAWNELIELLPTKEISPTVLFDSISYLINSRCQPETAQLYRQMREEFSKMPDADPDKVPLFWLGYPLWYHRARYLKELLDGCRISGSNYITWWSLDYQGETPMEQLYSAYNFTFLNLSREARQKRLKACLDQSGAAGAIALHNKSCKCDFVSAKLVDMPQAELEIDMIDRGFLDMPRAKRQIEQLLESI